MPFVSPIIFFQPLAIPACFEGILYPGKRAVIHRLVHDIKPLLPQADPGRVFLVRNEVNPVRGQVLPCGSRVTEYEGKVTRLVSCDRNGEK